MLPRLILPHGSRRRNFVRDNLGRVRRSRMLKFARDRYNGRRHLYYIHATTAFVAKGPLVSIIVPCFNTPRKYFEPLLASIFAQGYQNWELVLVDASTQKESNDYLSFKATSDVRIQYVRTENEGIAINTNKGLDAAKGEYIAFLDHDDTLDPDALADSMALFKRNPALGLVYSDEDKVSDDGSFYFQPHFKPDFSLDMLRNVNYITHFVVVKKAITDELKGIRKGFDGAQDYDFLLRVIDSGAFIGHVPKVLYHWREAEGSTAADFSNKAHVTDAGCKALDDHYRRNGIENVKAKAIELRPGFYKPIYSLKKTQRVISLDLKDRHLSDPELTFIYNKYANNEDVIKNDIEVTFDYDDSVHSQQVMHVTIPAVPASTSTDIASMFGLAKESGVASVSPKIIRQGKIYDMGVVEQDGHDVYLFRGLSPDKPLWFGSLEWVRNVTRSTRAVGINKNQKEGRHVVWAHAEFVALMNDAPLSSQKINFYNPNLQEQVEITEASQDYIVDLIKVKQ